MTLNQDRPETPSTIKVPDTLHEGFETAPPTVAEKAGFDQARAHIRDRETLASPTADETSNPYETVSRRDRNVGHTGVMGAIGDFVKEHKIATGVGGGLGLASIAATAAIVANIARGESGTAPEPQQTVAAAPAQPEATPTPTAETKPNVFIRSEIPPELQKYADMDVATFAALPKEEQWLYASWLDQYRAAFEARYYAVSGEATDAPVVITPNSSGMDLLTDEAYSDRIAQSLTLSQQYDPSTTTTMSGAPDTKNANKLIIARAGDTAIVDDIMSGRQGRGFNVDTQALNGAYSGRKDITILSETREGNVVTLVYTDSKDPSVTYSSTHTIIEFTAYDGTTEYRSIGTFRTVVQ